jgi:hypothetical protein
LTDQELRRYLRRLYRLMLLFAVLGAGWYGWTQGPWPTLGFLLGVLGSFGNLWLFNWLSRAMAPGYNQRKAWQSSAFVGRYLVLFALGYVIVMGLGVSPLPVVFGLFASTAAVLASSVFEIIVGLFRPESLR